MGEQSQILRQLSQIQNIERVRALSAEQPGILRSRLAKQLCAEFGFLDRRGQPQQSGCLKALRVLEKRGHFALTEPRTKPGLSQPRRLVSAVPPPEGVPTHVGELVGLELVLVENEELTKIWNTLMEDEHPRKAGPLVGRQLRYLIKSEHGWLGGLGFAAAALHLSARDRWIGWDLETRRANLDRLVGMSRFLIRSSVHCKNLASHVLGLVMRRVESDFETRYGYKPWLIETFVDQGEFGTCYQAANWTRVGSTQGRGRQDRQKESAESVKQVYVHVLAEDFRSQLGLPEDAGRGPLPLDTGLEADTWVEREFGGAPLNDKRLIRRLVQSARMEAASPMLSFPGASGGDKALVKGHYRLLDQPDDSAVNMENILLPHREQTMRRMLAEQRVLCIHDGTDLDYNGATECKGLGVIGTNQTGANSRGLHLHSTLAVSKEGLPLGVLGARCDAPLPRSADDQRASAEVPIEEKKTYDWILAMQDCEAVAAEMPHTKILQVMDREADIFELFDKWREGPRRTHLLVRAKHDRNIGKNAKLFESVKSTKVCKQFELHINRLSARAKRSKQKARAKRDERVANMSLRYQQVELPAPPHLKNNKPIAVSIVHLLEEEPPPGVEPVEWYLLTTMEVASADQAEELVKDYTLRWRIEDWHRVLKSGCGVEELRNETAERLKRALAIYIVIAWRIMLLTLLGRETPELPAEVLFTDVELEALTAYAKSRRDLKPPTSLGDAVRLVARLGGYQDRKNDPPPGHQILWVGYSQLRFLSIGYLLGRQTADTG